MQAPLEPDVQQWVLLIHQLPPKPDYVRVKVRRRLAALGAVALKSTVYALPFNEKTLEDFQWLRREIVAEQGEATLVSATFIDGVTDRDLVNRSQRDRNAEYEELVAEAAAADADLDRLRQRLLAIEARDHFTGSGRAEAEAAIRRLEAVPGETAPAGLTSEPGPRPSGATWVTRQGVFVDRIASAWLIRRFIDPDARFRFVVPQGYQPEPGELRFDMFEGEFTHVGGGCTFETLLARFRLTDPALEIVGRIVHDIDCKDDKFGRPENGWVASLLRGIALTHPSDSARIEAGMTLFDALHASLREKAGNM